MMLTSARDYSSMWRIRSSSDIQSALLINSVERSVDQFAAIVEIVHNVRLSRCAHLVSFAKSTVVFWYNILLERLVR